MAVSASECMASASMEPEPVITAPMNFATVIPASAENAARIAFLPPPDAMAANASGAKPPGVRAHAGRSV
ncbi:hypothetical protein Ntsu_63430 [Nocardia sp. IFM 10818]